eukprot:TRINITY_DN51869_c0_g1_i1.p1 TRINITY_DN51869_c0_g1~~TRINITY_DN51869_c0_g1_i1.p1  ORF type:complete len:529 (-),score=8.56 TRINITY_DN51869_c0_g1_i1:107-1615(-)
MDVTHWVEDFIPTHSTSDIANVKHLVLCSEKWVFRKRIKKIKGLDSILRNPQIQLHTLGWKHQGQPLQSSEGEALSQCIQQMPNLTKLDLHCKLKMWDDDFLTNSWLSQGLSGGNRKQHKRELLSLSLTLALPLSYTSDDIEFHMRTLYATCDVLMPNLQHLEVHLVHDAAKKPTQPQTPILVPVVSMFPKQALQKLRNVVIHVPFSIILQHRPLTTTDNNQSTSGTPPAATNGVECDSQELFSPTAVTNLRSISLQMQFLDAASMELVSSCLSTMPKLVSLSLNCRCRQPSNDCNELTFVQHVLLSTNSEREIRQLQLTLPSPPPPPPAADKWTHMCSNHKLLICSLLGSTDTETVRMGLRELDITFVGTRPCWGAFPLLPDTVENCRLRLAVDLTSQSLDLSTICSPQLRHLELHLTHSWRTCRGTELRRLMDSLQSSAQGLPLLESVKLELYGDTDKSMVDFMVTSLMDVATRPNNNKTKYKLQVESAKARPAWLDDVW